MALLISGERIPRRLCRGVSDRLPDSQAGIPRCSAAGSFNIPFRGRL